ncbi:MAG TPA: cation:proton antiporter, partial [Casimicrobiaceae bacterium]|nr:cation:proton antiporter [Casimicrobiaceae bacterium]
LIGAALFYLTGSTLASCALYLLAELIERSREIELAPPIREHESDRLPFRLERREPLAATAALADTSPGIPIPLATSFIGLGFVGCALMIAGLPPLSGFVAKFAMLGALLEPSAAVTAARHAGTATFRTVLFASLLVAGLLSTIALSRTGVRHFWAPHGRSPPRLRVIECAPIALLLIGCVAMAIFADPLLRYTRAAAQELVQPARYIEAVISTSVVPGVEKAAIRSGLPQ